MAVAGTEHCIHALVSHIWKRMNEVKGELFLPLYNINVCKIENVAANIIILFLYYVPVQVPTAM